MARFHVEMDEEGIFSSRRAAAETGRDQDGQLLVACQHRRRGLASHCHHEHGELGVSWYGAGLSGMFGCVRHAPEI